MYVSVDSCSPTTNEERPHLFLNVGNTKTKPNQRKEKRIHKSYQLKCEERERRKRRGKREKSGSQLLVRGGWAGSCDIAGVLPMVLLLPLSAVLTKGHDEGRWARTTLFAPAPPPSFPFPFLSVVCIDDIPIHVTTRFSQSAAAAAGKEYVDGEREGELASEQPAEVCMGGDGTGRLH
jgi:hypothetical protein